MHPGNLPLKEIAFNEFKLTQTQTNQISEPSFFKSYCLKILNKHHKFKYKKSFENSKWYFC